MFWNFSSTEALLRPRSFLRNWAVEFGLGVALLGRLEPQHLEVGGHGRLHFGPAPVFSDACYLEAQAMESGNDGGLSARKVSGCGFNRWMQHTDDCCRQKE